MVPRFVSSISAIGARLSFRLIRSPAGLIVASGLCKFLRAPSITVVSPRVTVLTVQGTVRTFRIRVALIPRLTLLASV